MLTRLELRNFQNHERLIINLSLVTCLVGRTDAGKSAVLRALCWLCLNEPSGDEFIAHGKERCEVVLEFDERVLKRVRGKSINYYELDGKKFHAFGTSVPPEVQEALKVSGLNFQRQHDPPFWLSLPPSLIARELNQVVDLSLIDDALTNIHSQTRKAKADLDASQRRLEEAQNKVEQTTYVEELKKDVERLCRLEEQVNNLRNNKESLSRLLTLIREAAKKASLKVPDLSKANQLASELKELQTRKESLWRLLERVRSAEAEAKEAEQRTLLAEQELAALGNLCPSCGRPLVTR